MNGRVCGALVQFGCYQHRHSPPPLSLSLSFSLSLSHSFSLPSSSPLPPSFLYDIIIPVPAHQSTLFIVHNLILIQEGIWGGVIEDSGARRLVTARVQPGYVTCTPQGRLPGCLFKFDDLGAQCRTGRQGKHSICTTHL